MNYLRNAGICIFGFTLFNLRSLGQPVILTYEGYIT